MTAETRYLCGSWSFFMWPSQFGGKLVLGKRCKWSRPRRQPPETEMLTIFVKTKPRRDVV